MTVVVYGTSLYGSGVYGSGLYGASFTYPGRFARLVVGRIDHGRDGVLAANGSGRVAR